jgi:hypothetical protein
MAGFLVLAVLAFTLTTNDRSPKSLTAAATTNATLLRVPGDDIGGGRSYFAGTLVKRSRTSLTALDNSGATWTIAIDPSTDVCRGPCSKSTAPLQPGDRIELGVTTTRATGPHALWIVANGVSDFLEVDAIDGNLLTVHSTRHPEQPNSPYTLIVEPASIFQAPSGPITEQRELIQVGDNLYFTGSTVAPGATTAIAGRVFPEYNADGTVKRG